MKTKIQNPSWRGAFVAATLLALSLATPLKSEVVTWKFSGHVTGLLPWGPRIAAFEASLPPGSPVRYSITFDTSIPGQLVNVVSWPEMIYPLPAGAFQSSISFGPYAAASNAESVGSIDMIDDDTFLNSVDIDVVNLSQTAGPTISVRQVHVWLSSFDASAVVGTAIPLRPFPLSLAAYKGIRVFIRVGSGVGLYLLNAEISETPCDLLEALESKVADAGLPAGTATSLLSKLSSAGQSLCDDNAANSSQRTAPLGAFLNEVRAQRGKKIPADLADSLTQAAQAILDAI